MAKAVLRYLQQLAIKFAATKLFNLGMTALGFAPPGAFNGGYVVGYNSGGLVQNGFSTRDSVNAKLAKGEFVVRKKAVDAVGVDFMADLNKRGAAAVGGKNTNIIQFAKREPDVAKIYPMAPGQQHRLGPKDVVLATADDIIQGGTTKQLIRQVAFGK